jgi:hypothetical protein
MRVCACLPVHLVVCGMSAGSSSRCRSSRRRCAAMCHFTFCGGKGESQQRQWWTKTRKQMLVGQ